MKSVFFCSALLAILMTPPALLQASESQLLDASFATIRAQARDSEVRWYMFGGWAHVNAWVDGYVTTQMKKRYNIDLTRIPMDAGVFVNKLLNRQTFYALTGGPDQYLQGFDQDLFERQSLKLWAFLNEIEPWLWQQGQTYPKNSASLDTLFSRGEVAFGMSYHPPHAQNKILEGTYPESVRTFVLKDGSISNTHYTAIPFNAPNKAGAMVLANFLISTEPITTQTSSVSNRTNRREP